jgi:hypothetical protein
MGCFNTQGFLSKLDIEYGDKVFLLICAPYSEPIKWDELDRADEDVYAEHSYNGTCNRPISYPIFGEYDDYGGICNIERDQTVERLEEVLGDRIENIIEIIKMATVLPRAMSKEEIDKYNLYKYALKILDTEEDLKKEYEIAAGRCRDGHKFMSFDKFKEMTINATHCELTWTMDHRFVYDTLSIIYNGIKFPSTPYEICNNDVFATIWSMEKINEYPLAATSFASFVRFIKIQHLSIDFSYPSGQEYDWKRMKTYIDALSNFITNKIEKENQWQMNF